MQRCPKSSGHHHIKDCNQNEPCCAKCNEKHSAAYKGCQKYKEAKQKAPAVSYAEALKNKPEYKDKEGEQKIASDAQTQIENNLESMLSGHLTKLENKIEQITKIANERLRINLQEPNRSNQHKPTKHKKNNNQTRKNIGKRIKKDLYVKRQPNKQ